MWAKLVEVVPKAMRRLRWKYIFVVIAAGAMLLAGWLLKL